jgi:hypothetical protein
MTIPLSDEPPPESTGKTTVGFEHLLASEREKIAAISARYHDLHDDLGQSAIDFTVTLKDGSTQVHAIPLGEGKVVEAARLWLADLERQVGFKIPFTVAA